MAYNLKPTLAVPAVKTLSRSQYVNTFNLSNNSVNIPTNNNGLLPNDYFLYALRLKIAFRVTNPASGGPTAVLADAPFSYINEVRVSGTHRLRGTQEPFFTVRGSDLNELVREYTGRQPYFSILVNGAAATALSLAASATNDVEFILHCPFTPMQISPVQQVGWLLDAPNYYNLKLEVITGDANSLFSGQTTQPVFTAYGSNSNSPTCDLTLEQSSTGSSVFGGFVPARLWRYYYENTSNVMTQNGNNARLASIPTGQRIRNILLKTGVKATGVTAGKDAYASTSWGILTSINFNKGTNKVINAWIDQIDLLEQSASVYKLTPSVGYDLIDFVHHGDQGGALNLTTAINGPTGDVDTYLSANVTGAANQAALLLYEEMHDQPMQLVG